MFELFVISSMGRSGSTLVRNELAKCDKVSCLDSPGSIKWLEKNRDFLINDSKDDFGQRLAMFRSQYDESRFYDQNIRYQFSKSPDEREKGRQLETRLLLKGPLFFFGEMHENIYRNANMIHILRSPMDITASYCRPLQEGAPPFLYSATPPDSLFAMMVRFADLFGFDVEIPEGDTLAEKPVHLVAAELVRCHYELLALFLSKTAGQIRSHVVRYEALVTDPASTVQDIFDFIGVGAANYRENDDFYIEAVQEGGIVMNRSTAPDRMNRGHEIFTAAQIDEIWEIVGDVAKNLEYPHPTGD